jgi:hypothetical protein
MIYDALSHLQALDATPRRFERAEDIQLPRSSSSKPAEEEAAVVVIEEEERERVGSARQQQQQQRRRRRGCLLGCLLGPVTKLAVVIGSVSEKTEFCSQF